MIDINLYRFRIGCFRPNSKLNKSKNRKMDGYNTGNRSPDFGSMQLKFLLISSIYIYFILCMLGIVVGMLVECKLKTFSMFRFHRVTDLEILHIQFTNIKLFSSMLIGFLIKRDLIINKNFGCFIGLLKRLLQTFHISPYSHKTGNFICSFLKKIATLVSDLIIWTFVINSVLIVIINPSLLNPGPLNSLKVVSFNCQGLIPFSELDSMHPNLDVTKMLETNLYLVSQKPDIFMLNETWLKKSIRNSELFPVDVYKIFRIDRSNKTHPIDPRNPTKFRRNGGGVLIAIRRDLDVVSTKIEITCAGEILGVTLKFNDGRKLVLCSYYRVGTLGIENHNEFKDFIRKVRSRRGVKGVIVAGDLNMPKIDWDNFSSSENIDQLFLDSFSNFELEQLIKEPTHKYGNLLDLVLTDKSALISDINVSDLNKPCKSDHFCISFGLKSKFKKIKVPKREVYNYKRADWSALNSSLGSVDWDNELQGDIHVAWNSFKKILFCHIEKHIPKIKIGGVSQPSWFDAEAHQLCREKERLHKKYKNTDDPVLKLNRYLKFSRARKKFKDVVSKKMDDSFEDDDDSGLITKKFWSYVKATANSTRIPELVHHENTFKSKPLDQAELFNTFFYNQFSESSTYNISIDNTNHEQFKVDFSTYRVCTILKNINPNKAMGPDKIHGRIFKNCSQSLAKPLSSLFKISYYSGSIPIEWKSALVVPVHKKGPSIDP